MTITTSTAPEATSSVHAKDAQNSQFLFIIRHGDRWDYSHPEWKKTAARKGDPSLSSLGHRQARDTGHYLDQFLTKQGIHAKDITLLSSPFLRCVQTSNEILSEFTDTPGDVAEIVSIKPEYSVFEMDLHGHDYHASLPNMAERKCYFPRLDESYESIYVPPLPETSKEVFFQRCDKAIDLINKNYPFGTSSKVIIVVTHAAGCIGLTKAAAKKSLTDIKAAYPCVINCLTRNSNSEKWDIDSYDKEGGMNGFIGHLKDLGEHTEPWNHFGDKSVNNGYTGPPNSS